MPAPYPQSSPLPGAHALFGDCRASDGRCQDRLQVGMDVGQAVAHLPPVGMSQGDLLPHGLWPGCSSPGRSVPGGPTQPSPAAWGREEKPGPPPVPVSPGAAQLGHHPALYHASRGGRGLVTEVTPPRPGTWHPASWRVRLGAQDTQFSGSSWSSSLETPGHLLGPQWLLLRSLTRCGVPRSGLQAP